MNAMEFQKNISVSMMHAFGYFSILYRKRSYLYFDFLHNFNGPGLCFAKRILPKEILIKLGNSVANELRIFNCLFFLPKWSDNTSILFEIVMDEARGRRLKRRLILNKNRAIRTQVEMCCRSEVDHGNLFDVPISYGPGTSTLQRKTSNGNLFEVPILYGSGNVENTLVLSQLNDEILQRCDKEVIDDNLLDVPMDVMVEEVATDFIPNNASPMFGSTSHESNTISDDVRNEHFIHVISLADVAPPTDTQTEVTTSNVPLKRKFTEPWNFGKPTQTCESYGAIVCTLVKYLQLSGITMSKVYNFLDQISDAKETWRIRVRICRMWKAVNKRSGNNFISLDMIFIDEKI
nr:hypothetical protein CFP56_47408 [Quercus suber]